MEKKDFSASTDSVNKNNIFEHTYNEIQAMVDSKEFSEPEKKTLILNEMAKSIGIPSNLFERSIPTMENLYAVAQAAYENIIARSGDKTKLKNSLAYWIGQLKKDSYVIQMNGGSEASDAEKEDIKKTNSNENKGPVVAENLEKGEKEDTDTADSKKEPTTETTTETPEQKLSRLEKELLEANKIADTNEEKAAKFDLITKPHLAPKYLSMKYLDMRVLGKSRSPMDLLYHYRIGEYKRFHGERYKVNNLATTHDILHKRYGPDVQVKETNARIRKTMRLRWNLIEQAYAMVKDVKVMKKDEYNKNEKKQPENDKRWRN